MPIYYVLTKRLGTKKCYRLRSRALDALNRTPGAQLVMLSDEKSLRFYMNDPLAGASECGDVDALEHAGVRFDQPPPERQQRFIAAIQQGNLVAVSSMAYRMPGLLIDSSCRPTQYLASRRNALHIAAEAGEVECAKLILSLVTKPSFISLVADRCGVPQMPELSRLLLDYYLNMPDWGKRNTPLHLAAMYGRKHAVQLLVSYPQCAYQRNADGHYPQNIVCAAVPGPSRTTEKVLTIDLMLHHSYYVVLVRYEGNVEPPTVLEPMTIRTMRAPLPSGKLRYGATLIAVAGPMNRHDAYGFYREWKIPPRLTPVSRTHYRCSITGELHDRATLKCSVAHAEMSYHQTYPHIAMERLGRSLARAKRVGWKEYWPFLAGYYDLSDRHELPLLEYYLGLMEMAFERSLGREVVAILADLYDPQNLRTYIAVRGVEIDETLYPKAKRWMRRMQLYVNALLNGYEGPAGVRKAHMINSAGRICE